MKKIIPYLVGALLFAYVLARAVLLPITHDEAGTCLSFSTMPVRDIVGYTVPIPNNHILNTLLIKCCTHVFGWAPWSVRLPNLLGFLIYFFSSLALLKKLSSNQLFIVTGLIVLHFNPFLLDFFSLARGYALASSLMMASIYFGTCYLCEGGKRNLVMALFLAMAAVYTNFTTLNFYLAFVLLLGVMAARRKNSRGIHLLIIGLASLLLAGIIYVPITKMVATDQFVFWSSKGFYADTIQTLLVSSIYNSHHFGVPVLALALPLFMAFLIMLFVLTRSLWKHTMKPGPPHFFFFLLIGTVAVNILQHWLTKTPFLSGRTALFYYPLAALCLCGFAAHLHQQRSGAFLPLCLTASILGIVHLGKTFNFTHTYEWWFDANTTQVLSFLEKEHQKDPSKPVSLNTHWWFAPSFEYYRVTRKLDWLQLAPYHKETQPAGAYTFYYCTQDDLPALENTYRPLFGFEGNTRIVMKRK